MALIDIFFPKQCILCSKLGTDICDRCLIQISRALPQCLVCGKINTNGEIHKQCLNIDNKVIHLQGWNISQKYYPLFKSRKEKNLYSVYEYLLKDILKRSKIQQQIYRIEVLEESNINSFLKSQMFSDKKSQKLCLIGEKIENKEYVVQQILKYNVKDTLILTIF